MTDITITYLIIVGAVALFVWNRLPVAVVALLTPMALFYTGILDVREVVAGFGDPVVLFVASLLVLGTALEAAGVTTWAGQGLVKRAGASPAKLLVMLMLLCAVLSSALGFMGTVAALLPVAVASATRAGLATSRVLMPMAFAGSAGGVLTLTASPVNMIVSSAAEGARVRRGQLIATVGRSGRTTGANLHFEVRKDNVAHDPLRFRSPRPDAVAQGE